MHDRFSTQCLKKLAHLGSTSYQQISRYLTLLEARNYADSTIANVAFAIKSFLTRLPAPRQSLLTQDFSLTTPADIDSFVTTARCQGLKPATINWTLSLLGEFFEFLREGGDILVQPIIGRRHRLAAPKRLPRPMPDEVVVQFFKVIDSLRDRVLFLLMLRCGLRVSEACSLPWSAVDCQAGSCRIDNSKGQVDRLVYLAPDLLTSLELWQCSCPKQSFLFPSPTAKGPLSTRQAERLMRHYLQSAGLSLTYTPHSLRHTFATQLLNAGVSLEVLKELMGHRSLHQTLQYTRLYDATKRQQYDQAMNQIERRLAALGR